MSIFATIAIVCTMATCNNYVIDHAETMSDGVTNTRQHTIELEKALPDEKLLVSWLTKHQVSETVFEIVSIDIETQEIKEDDLP